MTYKSENEVEVGWQRFASQAQVKANSELQSSAILENDSPYDLSPPDRAIEVAIANRDPKNFDRAIGRLCRGGLVEHRLAQPCVSILVNV